MKSLRLLSPAKVNLYLQVLNKRKDGFHNIVSIMERVSLCDYLKIDVARKPGITFKCNWPDLENDHNLAIRAARLMQPVWQRASRGISITLTKRIPVGSGLGGASSNAASVIMGLNRLLNLRLSEKQMFSLGARLGSDVNFFLSRARFALVRGRGEKIIPIDTTWRISHYLVLVPESISTARIYRDFSQKARLTNLPDNATLMVFALKKRDSTLLKKLLFNNLTPMALEASRRLRRIYNLLNKEKNTFVLSGSGASLVCFPSRTNPCLRNIRKTIEGIEFKKVTTF